jgi:hypothetical protein
MVESATASAARVPTKPTRTKDVPAACHSGHVKAGDSKLLEMRRWAAVGVHGSMVPRLDGSFSAIFAPQVMQSTESGGDFRLIMAVLPLGQQCGRNSNWRRYPYELCVAPSREKFVHGICPAPQWVRLRSRVPRRLCKIEQTRSA